MPRWVTAPASLAHERAGSSYGCDVDLPNPYRGLAIRERLPMRKEEQEMEATAAAPVRLEPAVTARHEDRVTDGDLLLRVAQGDTRAFETLYSRFARPVLGLALRLLRDRGRAAE